MTPIQESRKSIKKRAREILFSEYSTFLFSTLFLVAGTFGTVMLSKSYCDIIGSGMRPEVYNTLSLTFDIVSILFLYPFIMGYISLFSGKVRGRQCSISELFRFYSSKKELRSCYAFLLVKIPEIILKVVLPFFLLYILYIRFPDILEVASLHGFETAATIISKCFFLFEIITILTVLFLSGGLMLSSIAFCNGDKAKYTFREKCSFFGLRMSLLPTYLLAVLSFGIIFIAYALPFTFIVYSVFYVSGKASENTLKTAEFDIPANKTSPRHISTTESN